MKRNILFLLSLCMLLLTCSDGNDPIKEIENKDPFITLKKSNIDFTNDGGSEAILIESNVTWTAKSSASWCTVSPSSGNKSTASITLSAPANEDYDNRSCTVTIESGGISKTITVNQGENLGLLITQDRYELGNEESTIKVEVKANVDFEVEINDEWISKIETRGLTTSEMEFKIAKNDTYDNRDGSITIKQKGGNLSSTIKVYQSQEDALILSEKNFNLSSEAQSVEVEIKTNIDFEIIIPEEAKEWVSHATTRALRTETVVLDVAENKEYDERTVEVIVKDKKTDLEETVTIKQAANTGLIISEDKYELTNDGGTIEVEVKANVEFDIEISDSWITQVKTRGLTATKLQFQVAKNENYDGREGTITIKQKGGNLSSIIKVYQSQKDAIIISEKDLELTSEAQAVEVELKTNIDYEIIIPEDAKDWVSHTKTRALRTETVVLDIAQNKDYEERTVEVIVKDKKTDLEETVTIKQAANTGIIVNVETPGTLKELLGKDFLTIGMLTIKGEINGADINTIREMGGSDRAGKPTNGALYKLDISNAKIVEGGGVYYYSSHYQYDACYTSNDIITEFMFYECNSLKEIILPQNVTEIKYSGISHCKNIETIILNNSIKYIRDYALSGNINLININLPNTIEFIGKGALESCVSLEYITLPNNTKYIPYGVFFGCSKLKSIELPNTLEYIEESAFSYCKSLETIEIPNSTISISSYAFYECINIKSVTLGENIKVIEHDAFNYCDKITEIKIKNPTPPTLGYYLFIGPTFTQTVRENCKVYIPKGSYETYYTSQNWRHFENLIEMDF